MEIEGGTKEGRPEAEKEGGSVRAGEHGRKGFALQCPEGEV